MVAWKLISLRKLKLSVVAGAVEKELHSNLYEIIERGWHIFRTKYVARAREYLLAVFFLIAKRTLRFTSGLIHRFQARHAKWYDMVKGKGVIKKKGSVSFFLQDVAEYKKSIRPDNT